MIRSDNEKVLQDYPGEVGSAKSQWLKAKMERQELEAKIRTELRDSRPGITEKAIEDLMILRKERREALLVEIAFEETFLVRQETLRVAKADARNFI